MCYTRNTIIAFFFKNTLHIDVPTVSIHIENKNGGEHSVVIYEDFGI